MVLGLRTNLVIEDGLPHIFEETENLFTVLNRVSKTLCFRPFIQEPQPLSDVLEPAGRNSGSSAVGGNNSIQYHFAPSVQLFHFTWIRIESFF